MNRKSLYHVMGSANRRCSWQLTLTIDFKGTKQGWGSVLLPVEEEEQEYASAVRSNLVHAEPPKTAQRRK